MRPAATTLSAPNINSRHNDSAALVDFRENGDDVLGLDGRGQLVLADHRGGAARWGEEHTLNENGGPLAGRLEGRDIGLEERLDGGLARPGIVALAVDNCRHIGPG